MKLLRLHSGDPPDCGFDREPLTRFPVFLSLHIIVVAFILTAIDVVAIIRLTDHKFVTTIIRHGKKTTAGR